MREWQTMDTAPKDGTDIMVFSPKFGVVFASYDEAANRFYHCGPQEDLLGTIWPLYWTDIPRPNDGQ